MTTTHRYVSDNLGVEFRVGDIVTVTAWGDSGVRITDTGRRAVVTGFTPRGNIRLDTINANGDSIANGKAVRPGCLLVARRDGTLGHEGNVR